MATTQRSPIRTFLWQRPRAHGEIWEDREVSFLELFYDLVYVVVIARAAHTLAHHVSWDGVFDFLVVFALIWLAWLNGTLHHELHGREDVRSRMTIFAQMILLAILAVYTGHATDVDGGPFALVYAALMGLFTLMWVTVWRHDAPEYRPTALRYTMMMAVVTLVMAASSFVGDDARTYVWLAVVVAVMVVSGIITMGTTTLETGVTASMVERFGLFTIIVLGEVVVGVVDGLSELTAEERTATTIIVGALTLTVGFGFWWSYFDFTGRRLPRSEQPDFGYWMIAHLPATAAIAAAGAGMVDLVAHADDDHAPAATGWLIGVSAAVMLASVVVIMTRLRDYQRLPRVYRPVSGAMLAAAVVCIALGAWNPAPLVFVLCLTLLLAAAWILAITLFFRAYDLEHLPE